MQKLTIAADELFTVEFITVDIDGSTVVEDREEDDV
jgi:hypothetical protein